MARVWTPWSSIILNGEASNFPRLRDVASRGDKGFHDTWLAAQDGTLWALRVDPIRVVLWFAGKVASPGHIVRLSLTLDDTLFAVDESGALWSKSAEDRWARVSVQAGIEPIKDVAFQGGDILVTRRDGASWRTSDGTRWRDMSNFMPVESYACRDGGDLFCIDQQGILWRQEGGAIWTPETNRPTPSPWVDISVSFEGTIWLVASDGSMWTTSDMIAYLQITGDNFYRVTAGRYEIVWAIKKDGTVWGWENREW